jgi:phosphoribosylanthranilate isomerase
VPNATSSIPAAFRTRIKICGVSRLDDALAAAAAGADAIGLVCHRAAGRYVPPDVASRIVAGLPAFVTPVALFVDAGRDEVLAVCAEIGVRQVQYHGHETPEVVRAVGLPALKAIRADPQTLERDLDIWRAAVADGGLPLLKGLVLESPGPGVGGTGKENDWAYLADVARRGGFAGLPPIIAAGGLTPVNVGIVVRSLRPWAVDVSSGVERVRGEKAAEMIENFVRAVRDADGPLSPGHGGRGLG